MDLGSKLKEVRLNKGFKSTSVADQLGIDRSHLSKIENNLRKPSERIIRSLIEFYSLPSDQAKELLLLGNYGTKEGESRAESSFSSENQNQQNQLINVPANIPVLYTDSAFVTAGPFGILFEFAQTSGIPGAPQNIVSKIGLSVSHARVFNKVLSKKILEAEKFSEEFEKKRNEANPDAG